MAGLEPARDFSQQILLTTIVFTTKKRITPYASLFLFVVWTMPLPYLRFIMMVVAIYFS